MRVEYQFQDLKTRMLVGEFFFREVWLRQALERKLVFENAWHEFKDKYELEE